jgi:chitinase
MRHVLACAVWLAAMGCSSGGGGGNGGANASTSTVKVTVTIDPMTVTVAHGGTVTFRGSQKTETMSGFADDVVIDDNRTALTWVVQEGASGGTLSPDAYDSDSFTYTAPAAVGTYHVVATSTADKTVSVTSVVTVQ